MGTLTKHFQQLHVYLIDEEYLIGETLLYKVDKHLWQIKHKPTSYFENVDLILSGDLYQEKNIKKLLVFEESIINKKTILILERWGHLLWSAYKNVLKRHIFHHNSQQNET